MATPAELAYKYHRVAALGYKRFIEASAARYGLPPALIAAIGSRESGWGLLLKPKGPGGAGDNGNGKGLMQIDRRYHEFARTGNWKDPAANIEYGTALLAEYIQDVMKRGVSPGQAVRVAVAGYNQGTSGAVADWKRGDPDLTTTGHNYSRDVLARAALFARDFADMTGAEKKTLPH